MRSVEDQLIKVTAAAVAPRPVRVAISEAQGLLCAEDVITERPLPGFDQAAIDGYAVRSVDVTAAGTDVRDEEGELIDLTLPVVGEVVAGSRQPIRLQPRQTVRVDTGAPLPTLADAVLPVEFTDGGRARIKVFEPVRSGDYVRRIGDDVQPGDVAVRAGTIIGAAQVGLLAAVGQDKVLVHPRPRLSVISIGGELIDIDRTPGPGQVYDVNSYALAAAARDAGADVNRVGIVSADPRRLRDVVEGQLVRSEVVVIAGAVGGWASDQVREALDGLGELEVDRVAMHPGSVQGFGQARARRGAHLPAARESGECLGGVRGDGPSADPDRARPPSADASNRERAHHHSHHLDAGPQGLPARATAARRDDRRLPGAAARQRQRGLLASAGVPRRGQQPDRGGTRRHGFPHR